MLNNLYEFTEEIKLLISIIVTRLKCLLIEGLNLRHFILIVIHFNTAIPNFYVAD